MKKTYVAPQVRQNGFAAPLVLKSVSIKLMTAMPEEMIESSDEIESRAMLRDRFWEEDEWEDYFEDLKK